MSLNGLYNKLNYNSADIYKKGELPAQFSTRTNSILTDIDYDSIYFLNDEAMIMFKEFQSLEENHAEINKLSRDFWNLGEIPILFVKLNNQYLLYNANLFDKNTNNIWKEIYFDNEELLNDFNYFNLISDSFWMKYKDDFDGKNKVDTYLLRNLNLARDRLLDKNLSFKSLNSLIARLIMSRCLIDKNILKRENFFKIYNMSFEDIILDKSSLYSFFDFLKNRFGGDLFYIDDSEFDEVSPIHLKILNSLFKGEDLGSKQSVLFDVYDFSIIPPELISNIYESFLNNSNQRNSGICSTPMLLADYIVENTVADKLNQKSSCRILDPSCGSGIFLVKSLKKLIEKHSLTDNEMIVNLASDSIFGIDIDENAVNISIFSIYITLLDYADDFSTFRFPDLKNRNLFACDFFDDESLISQLGDFDCIVGNPPWFQAKGRQKLFEKYSKKKKVNIVNRQIGEAFISRATDFLKKDGTCSLILSNEILYSSDDLEFRRYMLENFTITEIFDLTLVSQYLFKNAHWQSFILSFQHKTDDKHLINHISLKPNGYIRFLNRLVAESKDIKAVDQNEFLKYDWLFKTLLVGNSPDFNLIKRLKEENNTLGEFLSSQGLISGTGFKISLDGSGNDISSFMDAPYLNIANGDLTPYRAVPSGRWKHNKISQGSMELMKPPFVLVSQNLTDDFNAVSAYCCDFTVFDYNTFAIKGEEDELYLRNIAACINSDLFKYFFLMTGNTGAEKNRLSFSRINKFPVRKEILADDKLYNLVLRKENNPDDEDIDIEINNRIFKLYALSNMDRSLIDYMNKVTVCLIGDKDVSGEISEEILKDYVDVYIRVLKNIFNSGFIADVYVNDYVIGINFKATDTDSKVSFIYDDDTNEVLRIFGINSYEQTGDLFVKRDFKFIDENSFSIIKTKEYSNWLGAMAWMDSGEFLHLFLKNKVAD